MNSERVIHSLKTALACVIGFLLFKLANFTADQWLIITIIVVMCGQVNVGSVLIKSKMRFFGTLAGSAIASLTIIFLGIHPVSIMGVIIVSSIIFSYLATSEKSYKDAGPLGAVTVIIILLGQHPSIYVAAHRFFEISAGILIATFVSQLIFPVLASSHLRGMQVKAITQLCQYYTLSLISNKDNIFIQELDEEIIKSLSLQRSLAQQAAGELWGNSFDSKSFRKLLHCEKKIFRGIVCMHYAREMLSNGQHILEELFSLKKFNDEVAHTFHMIVEKIKNKTSCQKITLPSLELLKNDMRTIRTQIKEEDLIYLDGFLFCAKIIVMQLTELSILLERKLE